MLGMISCITRKGAPKELAHFTLGETSANYDIDTSGKENEHPAILEHAQGTVTLLRGKTQLALYRVTLTHREPDSTNTSLELLTA